MPEQARIIRWEDPPRARGKGEHAAFSRYAGVANEMRSRPGEWAVIQERPGPTGSGLATHIRMGQMYCFTPAGDFDACTRQVNGIATVYARYVGDGEAGDG